MTNLPAPKSNVNILAIDGGAMMGAVPARILSYLDGSAAATPGPNSQSVKAGINSLKGAPNVLAPLFDYFDIIIGTSTGGLLAAGLTVPPSGKTSPQSANALLDFYFAQGPNIFPLYPDGTYKSANTKDLLYPFDKASPATTPQPMFDNAGLCSAIAGTYGAPANAKCAQYTYHDGITWSRTLGAAPISGAASTCAYLSNAQTGLAITSFNGNIGTLVGSNWVANPNTDANPWSATINGASPAGPLILTGDTLAANGAGVSVLQACLMTSAFPTLLPPVPYDLQFSATEKPPQGQNGVDYFLDGGLYAGNPMMAAILLAQAMQYDVNCVVSVGCGAATQPSDTDLSYGTVWDWGSGIDPIKLQLGNGWITSQMSPFYSALLSFMGMGGGMYDSRVLPLAMPGTFYRLQTPISYQTEPSGQTPANPAPYYGTADALNGWVGDADAYMAAVNSSGEWGNMIAQIMKGGKAAQQ